MAHMRTSVLGPTALRTVSTYDSAKRRDLARDLADRIVVLDSSTGIHHAHCARIAGQVARAVHLTRLDSRRLVLGAMLHDLGKIGIDEAVWNHPNGLSPEQRRIMSMNI